MLNRIDFYFFSPTGGTRRTGEIFCRALSENIAFINLGDAEPQQPERPGELAVVAMPVFGGRLPWAIAERLAKLCGRGQKAVSLAVYGTRAYEDALLELNDTLVSCGFDVIASAAPIAEHAIVRTVGAGRPDAEDSAELQAFAGKVLDKLACGNSAKPIVPGDRPYKPRNAPTAPVCSENCGHCGACIAACPTGAISLTDGDVITDQSKCMMCMACIAACPESSRMLPPPLQEGINQKLSALIGLRRENEFFL